MQVAADEQVHPRLVAGLAPPRAGTGRRPGSPSVSCNAPVPRRNHPIAFTLPARISRRRGVRPEVADARAAASTRSRIARGAPAPDGRRHSTPSPTETSGRPGDVDELRFRGKVHRPSGHHAFCIDTISIDTTCSRAISIPLRSFQARKFSSRRRCLVSGGVTWNASDRAPNPILRRGPSRACGALDARPRRQPRGFFRDLLGMEETGAGRAARSTSAATRSSTTTRSSSPPRPRPGTARRRRARSPQALERRVAAIEAAGRGRGWVEGDLGHGRAFRFVTPEGHAMEIFWEVAYAATPDGQGDRAPQPPAAPPGQGVPVRRIDHLNLMVADTAPAATS